MPRESRHERSSGRYRPSRRSQSPRRGRSRSPTRHNNNKHRSSRRDSRSPLRRQSRERRHQDTQQTQPRRRHSPTRSRSPTGHRHQARSRTRSPPPPAEIPKVEGPTNTELQEMNEEDQMMALMGFSGFDTTKDKAVAGNKSGTANIKKQRKFRQYMNRKGGFNRLLDKQ